MRKRKVLEEVRLKDITEIFAFGRDDDGNVQYRLTIKGKPFVAIQLEV